MNDLKIFADKRFGEIRSLIQDDEIWFIGKDIGEALGYSNPHSAIKRHVDEDDKGLTLHDTLGGQQKIIIINEAGLYSLILSSQLPNAKKFKKWVTSEVLPTIRKSGLYVTDKMNNRLIQATKNLLHITSDHDEKIRRLDKKIEEQITIDHGEQRQIKRAVNKRVIQRLGGKDSRGYRSHKIRSLFYSRIYKTIYEAFGVASYKDIKRKDYEDCMKVINAWVEPAEIRSIAS